MARAPRDRSVRAELRVDLNGVTDAVVGAEAGVSASEFAAVKPRLAAAIAQLQAERAQGLRPFLDLPYGRENVTEAVALAERLRPATDTFVMLGIGGSALGARALAAALARPAVGSRSGRVELIVADNIDPTAFAAMLDRIDLRRTTFNVVSKSGETAETMAQFLVVRERLLREFGAVDYTKHILITTDAVDGSLRQIVNDEGFFSTDYSATVGGRFSILSPVHLMPAALLDIDVNELLAGAAAMDERCRIADPDANPAAMLAAARYLLDTLHGFQIAVLMPYSERLAEYSEWWRELWGESLGKRVDRDGAVVSIGQTPVRAIGASDQHSQIQLYLDGPADKVVTFLRIEDHGSRIEIPRSYVDMEDVAYLGGHTLGDLLNMEQRATELALAKRGRPTITISMPELNAFTMGQLLYLNEIETVLTGALFGIDPYSQPGIEEAKRLIFGLGGKPGFEDDRREVEQWLAAKHPRYVL